MQVHYYAAVDGQGNWFAIVETRAATDDAGAALLCQYMAGPAGAAYRQPWQDAGAQWVWLGDQETAWPQAVLPGLPPATAWDGESFILRQPGQDPSLWAGLPAAMVHNLPQPLSRLWPYCRRGQRGAVLQLDALPACGLLLDWHAAVMRERQQRGHVLWVDSAGQVQDAVLPPGQTLAEGIATIPPAQMRFYLDRVAYQSSPFDDTVRVARVWSTIVAGAGQVARLVALWSAGVQGRVSIAEFNQA